MDLTRRVALLGLAAALSACGSVPPTVPATPASATAATSPTSAPTAPPSPTTAPSAASSASPTASPPTASPATVQDIINGPVMPSYEVGPALAPYIGQQDLTAPIAVCEGRPLTAYGVKGREPGGGERLLACTVAVAAGWRAYVHEQSILPSLAADYLKAERALYAYAVTTLGASSKPAIDGVLDAMGAGPGPLPAAPVIRPAASLTKARTTGTLSVAALHAAYQKAVTRWIAPILAMNSDAAAGLLDPTGPALAAPGTAATPFTARLASAWTTGGSDAVGLAAAWTTGGSDAVGLGAIWADWVGEPSPTIAAAASNAWWVYTLTGDAAIYTYVASLVTLATQLSLAADAKAGITGVTSADVKTAIAEGISGSVSVAADPVNLGVRLSSPSVPFKSEFASAYTADHSKPDGQYGDNNCGPASLAMAIDYFVARGAAKAGMPAIESLAAANAIRGGAASNYHGYNGITNFGLDQSATGTSSVALLASYGLHLVPLTGPADWKTQLSQGHPVVILVDNSRYADALPYGTNPPAGFFPKTQPGHIIVVTGYDASHVYINDPLRPIGSGSDFAISTGDFNAAAGSWYGAGVAP
jgi:uncharacterized protein YvpB